MKTYWVDYKYSYDYIDEEGNLEHEIDGGANRFQCLKKDIKKEVTKYIKEAELEYEEYSNLKVEIGDFYETTDYEV